MLILHGYEISPYSDKVRRALRLKGLAFQTNEIIVSKAGKAKHISPTGKFPVLDTPEGRIVDSSDILRWLDRAHPVPPLRPDNARDAALADILEDWADESLYFYDLSMRTWPHNREWFLKDLLHHEPAGLMRTILTRAIPGALSKVARTQGLGRKSEKTIVADLTVLYDALSALLTDNDWLAGPRLSHADLAVRVMLNVLDRTREGRSLRNARPALDAWCTRVDIAAPPKGISA
ncbi:glutathione S-transferase family protein [Sandaracinobacteroides saxicola]|uniref:Glutathione S-transferase family protein n=1 Tax=Sandaracinobacteroides saxicola TaxID=2759707 RepID=A0A7G5ILN5_9SPHN|nr:glutathione S-transferase family protein [Sandaracinobacteroides saxicola]QMW24277.1 glutathione S-transferase family protein [Sandaracinobacteroides saxicola]